MKDKGYYSQHVGRGANTPDIAYTLKAWLFGPHG